MDLFTDKEKELKQREYLENIHSIQSPFAKWSELELKVGAKDPQMSSQIQEERLRRKLSKLRASELWQERRALADLKVRAQYSYLKEPQIQAEIEKHGLQGNPNARLIAARLLALDPDNQPQEVEEVEPTEETEE